MKRTPIKRRKRRPRDCDDPAYLDWLRSLPCRVCGSAVTSPHHRLGAGMGLRAPDREAINLCGDGARGCHGSIHALTWGPFAGWDRARRREFEARAVRELQEMWADRLTLGGPEADKHHDRRMRDGYAEDDSGR